MRRKDARMNRRARKLVITLVLIFVLTLYVLSG